MTWTSGLWTLNFGKYESHEIKPNQDMGISNEGGTLEIPPLGLDPSLKESFRGSFKYWEYPFMRINATRTLTFICDEQG